MNDRPPHRALSGKKICLVSSGHVGSNPRLVKEADALALAGAQVEVVCVDITRLPEVQARDDYVIGRGLWPCVRVPGGGRAQRAWRSLGQRVARQLFALGWRTDAVAVHAHSPITQLLSSAATAIPADLYIAHNLAALPAACRAASVNEGKLGFDAEDFHSGQLAQTPANALELQITRHIEARFLPRCDHLTAASPGIGQAYAKAYGVPTPVTLLNVFPKLGAPQGPTPKGTAASSPSLYWFSQTIGPGRGLETAIHAIAISESRPTLHLQGSLVAGYGNQLRQLALQLGVPDQLVLQGPVLPDELPGVAVQYDIGLATEQPDTPNRDLCLTNKLFTYLLAGIPILATATTAQTQLAATIPGVLTLIPADDAQAWAAAMDSLLLQDGALATARRRAWEAGQQRFNWDDESALLLKTVDHLLSNATAPAREGHSHPIGPAKSS